MYGEVAGGRAVGRRGGTAVSCHPERSEGAEIRSGSALLSYTLPPDRRFTYRRTRGRLEPQPKSPRNRIANEDECEASLVTFHVPIQDTKRVALRVDIPILRRGSGTETWSRGPELIPALAPRIVYPECNYGFQGDTPTRRTALYSLTLPPPLPKLHMLVSFSLYVFCCTFTPAAANSRIPQEVVPSGV